jgi:hypothetical protein
MNATKSTTKGKNTINIEEGKKGNKHIIKIRKLKRKTNLRKDSLWKQRQNKTRGRKAYEKDVTDDFAIKLPSSWLNMVKTSPTNGRDTS